MCSGVRAGHENGRRPGREREEEGRRGRAGRVLAGGAGRVRRVVRRPVPEACARRPGGFTAARRPAPPSTPAAPTITATITATATATGRRPSACPGRGGRPDGNRQPQDGSRRPGSRTTESRGPGSRGPGQSWTGESWAGRPAATVSGAGRPRACRGGRLQVFSRCPLADGAGGGHQHADGALGVLFGQGEQFAAVAGERGVHLAAGVGQVAALAQECGDVLLAQHDGLP